MAHERDPLGYDAACLSYACAGEFLRAWQRHQQLCQQHAAEWQTALSGPGDGLARYTERSRNLEQLAQTIVRLQREWAVQRGLRPNNSGGGAIDNRETT